MIEKIEKCIMKNIKELYKKKMVIMKKTPILWLHTGAQFFIQMFGIRYFSELVESQNGNTGTIYKIDN